MSKTTQQFFEQLKSGEQPSLLESIKEIGGQIWDGAKPMFDHGRSEAAKILFSEHSGHVMYMKGQEGGEKTQDQEHVNEVSERQRDDGREM